MERSQSYNTLSFQAGTVSTAVDELISGYETIVDTLPTVAHKVSEMHTGTRVLAEELESKMTNLIEGYGYLQSVAVEMPQSMRDLALSHRNTLISTFEDSSVVNQRFLDEQTRALENLRHELQSISEQRIMLSVKSREIINPIGKKSYDRSRSKLTLLRNKEVDNKSSTPSHGMTVKTVSSNPNDPIPIPSYKSPKSLYPAALGVQASMENISDNVQGWKYSNQQSNLQVRIGSLPEELEGLVTVPVDMTAVERRTLKKSRFKRIMRQKVQRTQAQVATLRETLMETSKKLNDDQMKAREELAKMLNGLQKDIRAHDDSVANVLGSVIQETMKRVDSLTSEPIDSDINKVLPANISPTKIPRRRIPARSSDVAIEESGYKVLTVGGSRNAVTDVSPSLKILAEKGSRAAAVAVSVENTSHEGSSGTATTHAKQTTSSINQLNQPASTTSNTTSPSQRIIKNDAESQSSISKSPDSMVELMNSSPSKPSFSDQINDNENYANYGSFSTQLVGDMHGVRWERVDLDGGGDFAHDPIRDQVATSTFPTAPPFNDHPLLQDSFSYGGGQVVSLHGASNDSTGNEDAVQSMTINHEPRYRIHVDHSATIPLGDYVDPSLKESAIAGQAFKPPTYYLNEELSRKAMLELQAANQASAKMESAADSYWLSRVYPLKAAGVVVDKDPPPQLPPAETTSTRNPYDEMQQHLLQVIQVMMKSQQDSAAGVQAMMLTLIDTYHQERLITAEAAVQVEERKGLEPPPAIVFPPQPSAADIAEALAITVKEIISSIPLNQPPQPIPIIIQAPAPEPQKAPTTIILKDEGIQAVSESQEESLPLSTVPSQTEIIDAVHDGIVKGIRDVLEIICPSDDLGLDDRNDDELREARESIRKNMHTIDAMERMIKASPETAVEDPAEHRYLHIDRNRRIESVIEAEIIESQKRQNLLKLNRKFEARQNEADPEESRIFREAAISSSRGPRKGQDVSSDSSSIRSSGKYRERYQNLLVVKSSSSSSSSSAANSTKKSKRSAIKQPPAHVLISKVLAQEATVAMMDKDDASLFGSEINASYDPSTNAHLDLQLLHTQTQFHQDDEMIESSYIDISASDRESSTPSVWESVDTSVSLTSSLMYDAGVEYDQAIENNMRMLKMHRLTPGTTATAISSAHDRKPIRLWRPH